MFPLWADEQAGFTDHRGALALVEGVLPGKTVQKRELLVPVIAGRSWAGLVDCDDLLGLAFVLKSKTRHWKDLNRKL
jgi:hypothetical protein